MQTGIEVNENYSARTSGVVSVAPTGQPHLHYGAGDNALRVVSGKLVQGANPTAGGYDSIETDQPITRIGGRVTFTPWSTGGGVGALVLWVTPVGVNIPASPIHFVISPEAWSLGYFLGDGSGQVGILNGLFDGDSTNNPSYDSGGNLVADGSTAHAVEIVLDRREGRCYVTLPDGTVVRSGQHDFLRTAATYARVESLRTSNAQTAAGWTHFWADSRGESVIAVAKRASRSVGPASVGSVIPAETVNQDVTIDATVRAIPGATATFTVPNSGRVFAEAMVYLDVTSISAGGWALLHLLSESNAEVLARTLVETGGGSGWYTVPLGVYNAGVFGESRTLRIGVIGVDINAKVKVDHNGIKLYAPALKITPCL